MQFSKISEDILGLTDPLDRYDWVQVFVHGNAWNPSSITAVDIHIHSGDTLIYSLP